MMILSSDLKLFGMVPHEKRRPGIRWAFDNVEVIGSPPKVFLQGTLLFILVFSIVCLFLIIFTKQTQTTITIIGTEALFLLLIPTERTKMNFRNRWSGRTVHSIGYKELN